MNCVAPIDEHTHKKKEINSIAPTACVKGYDPKTNFHT